MTNYKKGDILLHIEGGKNGNVPGESTIVKCERDQVSPNSKKLFVSGYHLENTWVYIEDLSIPTAETAAVEVAAVEVATAERVRVKLYFDGSDICLGGCCDENWLPLYRGEEYVASEFFKLVPGFDPVGKTVKELQEIERETNPYAIKARAARLALDAKLAAELLAAEETAQIEETAAEEVSPIEAVAAEIAKLYPALAQIKIDYPSLDISELEAAFKHGEVLEIKQIRNGSIPIFLVLRVWGTDQWVTHHYNAAINGFELGWYFRNFKKAKDNYNSRKRSETQMIGPVIR